MKRLILLFLLLAGAALAAIPTDAIWEVRSGGATTGSGFFNPSNANFLTDLAVTAGEGTSATPHVTSATDPFTANDVGSWVYVKTGTGWNSGVFYKISSQNLGTAVLDAATGHGVVLGGAAGGRTFTVTTVQGIGSATPGGNATYGVDYSQQNASLLNRTDLSCTSNASTTLTTATSSTFTAHMVGNGVHITTQGTGSFGTIGWYELVSVTNGTNVVLDVTPCNSGSAMAAATGYLGGGILSIGAVGSATARLGAVAGNTMFVTQGGGAAFSQGATDTTAWVGTATNPVQVIGYGTYRGDGYLGHTTTTGKLLITTNMPSYAYQATFKLTGTSVFTIWKNINFSVAGAGTAGYLISLGADSVFNQCVVTNPSTNTAAGGINNSNARTIVADSNIFMTGASGGATAAGLTIASTGRNFGNYIQMSQSTSTGPAVLISASSANAAIEDCTIIGNGGAQGINLSATGGAPIIRHNTIVGFVDGVAGVTGITGLCYIGNNMITDNTSNAINFVDAGAPVYTSYNRYRDVTTITGATNFTTATNIGAVTTDTGGPETDYINYGAQDLRLKTTTTASPGLGAAFPASASMGSRQAPATASASQVSYGNAK